MWCPYTVCLLIWVEKLETSHVLHRNKNKTYSGCWDHLSVSIGQCYKCFSEHISKIQVSSLTETTKIRHIWLNQQFLVYFRWKTTIFCKRDKLHSSFGLGMSRFPPKMFITLTAVEQNCMAYLHAFSSYCEARMRMPCILLLFTQVSQLSGESIFIREW